MLPIVGDIGCSLLMIVDSTAFLQRLLLCVVFGDGFT